MRRHQMVPRDGAADCTCGEPVRVLVGATPAENWAAHAAQAVDHEREEQR